MVGFFILVGIGGLGFIQFIAGCVSTYESYNNTIEKMYDMYLNPEKYSFQELRGTKQAKTREDAVNEVVKEIINLQLYMDYVLTLSRNTSKRRKRDGNFVATYDDFQHLYSWREKIGYNKTLVEMGVLNQLDCERINNMIIEEERKANPWNPDLKWL